MIKEKQLRFQIHTRTTTYLFEVTKSGHLKHYYYGPALSEKDAANWEISNSVGWGCSLLYRQDDPSSSLHTTPLEWSGSGCGDYRESPIEVEGDWGVLTTDFRYQSHNIYTGEGPHRFLWPRADGAEETLEVCLSDPEISMELRLYWSVFGDVICRKALLINRGENPRYVRKLMSSCVDFMGEYRMMNLHGDWIREAHPEVVSVGYSRIVNESLTGFSSNQHNPAFAVMTDQTTEWSGDAYGFNLIYSGNHYASLARSSANLTRIMQGISPANFRYELAPGESMETPDAVMTYSPEGLNGMSRNLHEFVNSNLVPSYWRYRERPILYNSWEGCMFDFNERKLLGLAREAKRLGCELFVLDDGWFGTRNDDTQGLGDYNVNLKKLPHGMTGLAERINKIGLQFGLWFEPEAVNENSDLYRAHPDWVLQEPGRKPLQGRNEYLLDLRMECVRDYIVSSVSDVLDSANITYVKWDMNRHSNILGAGSMEYILGLYDVMHRIFDPRPEILLESCASGGNRFDLGMMTISPQIWASDNTDPMERLHTQKGLSYFYPQSTMGCHVSASPHMQTMRHSEMETRGNVAFFGDLGYELDLDHASYENKKKIREQIKFYRKYQKVFQFGTFYRYDTDADHEQWQVLKDDVSMVGVFRRLGSSAPGFEKICIYALDPEKEYHVTTRSQTVNFSRVGGNINYLSPIRINPNGPLFFVVDQRLHITAATEDRTHSGRALAGGFVPMPLFAGSGYDGNQRLVGDGGSELYVIEETGR